jgi:hypothetical protein
MSRRSRPFIHPRYRHRHRAARRPGRVGKIFRRDGKIFIEIEFPFL